MRCCSRSRASTPTTRSARSSACPLERSNGACPKRGGRSRRDCGNVGSLMWDEQIDAAARKETTGSPGVDFTARVLRRIAPEGDSPDQADVTEAVGWRWRLAWIAPAALAAILVLAVAIDRQSTESTPAVDVADAGRQPAVQTSRPETGPALPAEVPARRDRTNSVPRPADRGGAVETFAAPEEVPSVDEIVIAPLAVATIEIG